jgi:hypothetical protein
VHRNTVLSVALLFTLVPPARSYSVLAHEAIIDSAWEGSIKPLLLSRYPATSEAELREAHAYAYAGAIVQDLGYYPFGSRFFSDLVHYVRSGDFIVNLIRDSQDLNEYAFSLGSLAHYAADTVGHSIAVNHSVPIEYPKLRKKFGNVVTYEDDPVAHLRVEFSFDVVQVARGHYAPDSYHDFIGFKVAKDVLSRAFFDTYGLELSDVFTSTDLAIGTYRRTVSEIIPEMTKVAWDLNKDGLTRERPGMTGKKFRYNLSRASYHKEWGKEYRKPGIGARIIAFFLRLIPKFGPFKALSFKPPTPETEKLFEQSFNRTLDDFRKELKVPDPAQLQLANRDFDTGAATRPGEYRMADDAYAKLVVKLAEKNAVESDVNDNVLAFFADLSQPYATKKDAGKWRETVAAIEKLRARRASR